MSKLDKRAISILVIALFLLSAIPFMSVSAQGLTVVVTGHQKASAALYTLETGPTGGTTGISTDTHDSTGYSVKLYDGNVPYADDDDYGAARVVFETDILFDDITSLSYRFKYSAATATPAVGAGAFPYLIFYIDTSSPYTDGTIDEIVVMNSGGDLYKPTEGVWNLWDLETAAGEAQGNWFFSPTVPVASRTFSDMQTAITEPLARVNAVKIAVGEGWAVGVTAYVEELEISDAFYPLEVDGADKGDTLTVTGTGVTSGSVVNVYWDYVNSAGLMNNTEANPDGTYEVELDVPSDVGGKHYVWIKDVETGTTLRYAPPIYVVPKLSLSPSSGLKGDEITVKGYGFSAESDVTVIFDRAVLTTTVETDELGYFTYKFDVPIEAYADYPVSATDSNGWTASKDFTVGASITLTPDEGPTGSIVTVEGRGWTPLMTITLTLDGTETVEVVDRDPVEVKSDGTFTAEVVIPDMASEGEYPLEATESTPGTKGPASEDFDVTGISEIVVSPTYGTPGATITVTGSNFTQIAGTDVVIELWGTSKVASHYYG